MLPGAASAALTTFCCLPPWPEPHASCPTLNCPILPLSMDLFQAQVQSATFEPTKAPCPRVSSLLQGELALRGLSCAHSWRVSPSAQCVTLR